MSLLAALFVGATAGTPLNILRTRGGGGEDFRSSSTFATKHTSAEPASLEGLLAAVDIDHLDRNAHVVATLGPASSDEDTIRALIRAGVNVFRLNASHRRPGDFEALVPLIREAAQQAGREVRILGDIQGPKFRCTPTKGGVPVALRAGQIVEFALCGDEALCSHGSDVEDLTRPGRITLTPTSEQTALVRGVAPGMAVLLDDGALALTVLERRSERLVLCKVVTGGALSSRKGINVPQLQVSCDALTAKDRDDVAAYVSLGVDLLALSFVQTADDVNQLLTLLDDLGVPPHRRPSIVAKIEKPQALQHIHHILALADGMMVARGDLGVELGLQRVPFAQKLLVRTANALGKYAIVATQMMESMTQAATPTRAEVADVANAVFDGADAVMLSAETAMGVDPANVVRWMGRVVAQAEAHAADLSPSF